MVMIRLIQENDIENVIELYKVVYGDDFPFKEFYDASWIKKGVFNENIRWFVAQTEEGKILGSAAVMLDSGGYNDLIGEFGRLVVHPEARNLNLGSKLFDALLEASSPYIDFGFGECRTAHTGAQKILKRAGFGIVGIEPHPYRLGSVRESMLFVCRLMGNAYKLRKNNPRVIPEIHALGSLALHNCGIEDDLIVESIVEPYPVTRDPDVHLAPLDNDQIYRLLRLSRGNREFPDIFGNCKLEYGFLKLKSHAGQYLVLYRGKSIVGGLGYVWDEIDLKIKVFEVISAEANTKGAIIEMGLQYIEKTYSPAYIQFDVNAHSPRMQRTLCHLGFAPVAYCPSMVYADGERLDVIKMVKLFIPLRLDQAKLIDEALPIKKVVEDLLIKQARGVEIDEISRQVVLFQGMTDVQIGYLCSVCKEVPYAHDEWIFRTGEKDRTLFIVLDGEIEIITEKLDRTIAILGKGETVGEMALIEDLPRSASVRCRRDSRLALIKAKDFESLIIRDPELGLIVYRNMAKSLSKRLRSTDTKLENRDT